MTSPICSPALVVNPAPLTIAVNNATRFLGKPNPGFSFTYQGFVNGDGPSSLATPPVASVGPGVTANSPPGEYPIIVGGATSPNYTITFVNGTLTVIAPVVTVARVQDVLNKKHQVTQVFVTFSGPVSENGADSTATYRLATPGKGGSYTGDERGDHQAQIGALQRGEPASHPNPQDAVRPDEAGPAPGLRDRPLDAVRRRRPADRRQPRRHRWRRRRGDPLPQEHGDPGRDPGDRPPKPGGDSCRHRRRAGSPQVDQKWGPVTARRGVIELPSPTRTRPLGRSIAATSGAGHGGRP